jgi:hypothetical protein
MPTMAQLLAVLAKYVKGLRSTPQMVSSPLESPQEQPADSTAHSSSSNTRQQAAAVLSSACDQKLRQLAVLGPP